MLVREVATVFAPSPKDLRREAPGPQGSGAGRQTVGANLPLGIITLREAVTPPSICFGEDFTNVGPFELVAGKSSCRRL